MNIRLIALKGKTTAREIKKYGALAMMSSITAKEYEVV
jgi:hypothetical protein